MKKEKNRRKQTAADAKNTGKMICPDDAAVTEELSRPRETPGDRAVDVLDNHTPGIDL